jgi:hypothetical protein
LLDGFTADALAFSIIAVGPDMHYQYALHRKALKHFGQNYPGLNSLAEPNLIRDQQPLETRIQELQERFELIRVESRPGSVERVDL